MSLPLHPTKRYPWRYLAAITHIIVHHSLTRTGSAAAYARYHISEYDWPGIAYHVVIDPDGTVNRSTDFNKIGYHCRGMNSVGIGIVLTGNFDLTDPTPEQMEALAREIVAIRKEFGRKLEVDPHSKYSEKTCPGKRFPWDALVERIAVLEYVAPPKPPQDPTVDDHEPNVTMPDDPEEPVPGEGDVEVYIPKNGYTLLAALPFVVVFIFIAYGLSTLFK